MQTRVVSFGYKHGLPVDVDLVLDCRFLPNPHWVDELRPMTGLDEPVRRYVLDQAPAQEFLDRLDVHCSRRCCPPTWPRGSRTSPWPSAAPVGGTDPWPSPRRWRPASDGPARALSVVHRDVAK